MRNLKALFVLIIFILTTIAPPQGWAQVLASKANASLITAVGLMPPPGRSVSLSAVFDLAHFKGMVIDPNDPFKFDFIIHKGNEPLNDIQKKQEYTKLIKYFLAALAVPDTDQWVNLSPYEKNRIIATDFGKTAMGRDLLAQDYLLKQLSSSLTNPNTGLGQKFWDQVYERVYREFGTKNIPLNTFNKVWIIPDKAVIYEKGNMMYVISCHLKVMTEEDYLATIKHHQIQGQDQKVKALNISNQVMREIIIPAIEKEANEGKNFAPLRQVLSGMLLATWYKRALKESILTKLYANKEKLKGVDQDHKGNEKIYQDYLKAYKKGVYNLIKEDTDSVTQEVIPRKYFAGGIRNNLAMVTEEGTESQALGDFDGESKSLVFVDTRFDRSVDMAKINTPLLKLGSIAFAGVLTAIALQSQASSVELGWNPPPSAYTGINLYEGLSSGTYTGVTPVGTVTNGVIDGLQEGLTYYFAATSTNAADGLESGFSNEFVYQMPYSFQVQSLGGGQQTFQLTGTINQGDAITFSVSDPRITNPSVDPTTGILSFTATNQSFTGTITVLVNGKDFQTVPVSILPTPNVVEGQPTSEKVGPYTYWTVPVSAVNGNPGTQYNIELDSTSDMQNWTPVGTYTLIGGLTNNIRYRPAAQGQQLFWRTVWVNEGNNGPTGMIENPFMKGGEKQLALLNAKKGKTKPIKGQSMLLASEGKPQWFLYKGKKLSKKAQEIRETLLALNKNRPEFLANKQKVLSITLNPMIAKNSKAPSMSKADAAKQLAKLAPRQFMKMKTQKSIAIARIPIQGPDRNSAQLAANGGIDFAQSNLDMQIKRDGQGMPLPVSQQNLDNIRIDGLVPKILDIKPVESSFLFNKIIEDDSVVARS